MSRKSCSEKVVPKNTCPKNTCSWVVQNIFYAPLTATIATTLVTPSHCYTFSMSVLGWGGETIRNETWRGRRKQNGMRQNKRRWVAILSKAGMDSFVTTFLGERERGTDTDFWNSAAPPLDVVLCAAQEAPATSRLGPKWEYLGVLTLRQYPGVAVERRTRDLCSKLCCVV